jgi:UDP-4-amino-4,6-dideoxy-N-acetyl-beta-L-altrosamine N-acetyltransferase
MAMSRREEYGLRPIEERDLDMVLRWRNSDRIRETMYTDHEITKDEHRAWFERLRKEPEIPFLVFEFQGKPIGVIQVTQIDRRNNKCFWGFYIGEPGAPPGSGTVLGYFGLKYIFEVLKIRKLCAEAFASNSASLRFHKRLGFVEEGRLAKHVLKYGRYEDVVSFALFQEDWLRHRNRIEELCFHEGGPG